MPARSWSASTSPRAAASAGSARSRRSPCSPSSPARSSPVRAAFDLGPGSRRASIGRLFVISGPSGVGKGTVVRRLLALRPELAYSVSATTRPPRPGEVDGREYRFVDAETFRRLVEDGAFLEWAEVFGHRYGTLIGPIAQDLEEGRDVILEIDIQGARTVRERMPDAVLIFLVPPSIEELVRRLRGRATESEADLARRIAAVADELAQAEWFDVMVVNDDPDRATAQVAAIIEGDPRTLRKEQDTT